MFNTLIDEYEKCVNLLKKIDNNYDKDYASTREIFGELKNSGKINSLWTGMQNGDFPKVLPLENIDANCKKLDSLIAELKDRTDCAKLKSDTIKSIMDPPKDPSAFLVESP